MPSWGSAPWASAGSSTGGTRAPSSSTGPPSVRPSFSSVSSLLRRAPPAAYVFAMAVYLSVGIPASRSVAVPRAEDTRQDQIEALRVLSAGNTIIIACLGAVLALQVRPFFLIADTHHHSPLAYLCSFCSPSILCPAAGRHMLTWLLCEQAGEEYARRAEAKIKEEFAKEHPAGAPETSSEADGTAESKKDK